ncbi:FIG005032: Putative cytoplasmic protein YbdZ in enterobactin biosynthesis operon [Cronobacter condimenti 1330]|uniref:FIG005032: Putative cytoplasmic protein YbdZ in enterobactin biosynthesis operon n=1 Tax=Cronobacter condimenti 1330 TaxID=1073999 RepID=K8AGF9_9ENTR|nr:MbtH family NRPS accessory protein [Cronobacter condimenti]ALB62012.1 invasin [Cronobacter condimenti 1330]CCJ74894.1 FIG005032: Putative cytoplasmic protein YbdZ in enterobactin biosynthesis operon [Cronobacter condimenti 1330]
MEFSNPFDNPQGRFWLLENDQQQVSLWPEPCALPPGWRVVAQPQSPQMCEAWLKEHWNTLKPTHFARSTDKRG